MADYVSEAGCGKEINIMNKARRQELKINHYWKRLIFRRMKEGPMKNLFTFRSHGAPCSCWACKGEKYNRAGVKQETFKMIVA